MSYGKISCIAKGSKKTNSPILSNSQYLVYSEFVLYKSNKFYYVNSANIINMFYKVRVDFDKLNKVFELTKILCQVVNENEDASKILQLFLNTVYMLDIETKPKELIIPAFKIKLFCILGFSPRLDVCNSCQNKLEDEIDKKEIFYDYVRNVFCCKNCCQEKDKKRYIKIPYSTLVAIRYIQNSDIKKIFSFELKDLKDFSLFGQVYADAMTNGI